MPAMSLEEIQTHVEDFLSQKLDPSEDIRHYVRNFEDEDADTFTYYLIERLLDSNWTVTPFGDWRPPREQRRR